METAASVIIDRPIEQVFKLTNDHVPEWSIVVVSEEVIEKTPQGVGTKFRTVTEDYNRTMEFDGTVTKYDPPHASTVELKSDAFDIVAEYTFEEVIDKTRVTQKSVVTGKGFFKVILWAMGWTMRSSSCKALQKELDSLKSFCERHPED